MSDQDRGCSQCGHGIYWHTPDDDPHPGCLHTWVWDFEDEDDEPQSCHCLGWDS